LIFVDTVAWLYLFGKGQQDPQVQKARQFIQVLQQPLCTSDLVVEETHKWLVHHGRPTSQALIVLRKLASQELAQILEIEPEDRTIAIGLVDQYLDQKLSYTDAISVALMKRLGLRQIFSFDRHFLLFPELERVPQV
jgi:predicted nucleic acid-binding protein